MQLNPTTLIFETVNFLLLLWLLTKLVYAPLRRAIEVREQLLVQQRGEIEQTLADAREQHVSWTRKNHELAELAAQVRNAALEDAVAEKGRMLSRAREDAEAERGKAERLLEGERRDAEQWVRSMAIEQSTQLTGRLLLSLAPQVLDEVLMDKLCEEIAREHDVLAQQAAPDQFGDVEITAAHMPTESMLLPLREALTTVLGRQPQFAVREDSSLLAGAVLRIGDRVFDASVAGQLDAFRERARALIEESPHG